MKVHTSDLRCNHLMKLAAEKLRLKEHVLDYLISHLHNHS